VSWRANLLGLRFYERRVLLELRKQPAVLRLRKPNSQHGGGIDWRAYYQEHESLPCQTRTTRST
jgi:hypothetical protein